MGERQCMALAKNHPVVFMEDSAIFTLPMKTYLLALLFLALLAPLQADTASHRQAAEDMLNLVNGPEAFQAGFEAILPTLTASLKQNGVPDAQIKQVETAFREWIKREIKWD